MKILLVTFFLFFTGSFFGQKSYSFDYLIEYQNLEAGDSIGKTMYLLTNSKDNSYYVSLSNENDSTLTFNFYHDVFRSFSLTDKKLFLEAKFVTIPCETVLLQKDNINLNRYDFKVYSDTLIDGKAYKNYSMQYRKASEEKKYNNGKSFYIVENGTEFHKPLKIFSAAFDISLSSESFPNGIAREIFNIGKRGLRFRYKLVSHSPTNKTIVIPNCSKLNY